MWAVVPSYIYNIAYLVTGYKSQTRYEVGNICIIPEFQRKGIGTAILRDVLSENHDKEINIQYFKQNLVGKLYERLGFKPNGETTFHYQMIRTKQ